MSEQALELALKAPGIAYYCPTCRQIALEPVSTAGGSAWHCCGCEADYPEHQVAGRRIPWLFPNPAQAHQGWRARVASFEEGIARQLSALAVAQQSARQLPETEARLTLLQRGQRQLQTAVRQYLEPLGFNEPEVASNALPSVDSLPQSQGLLSYRNNLFRDWSWHNGEAEAMLAAVNRILRWDERQQLGRTLTLGSGGGRLSFDLHQQYQPECSVLLDLNPLLTVLAATIVTGCIAQMPEFPVAPLSSNDVCRLQPCHLAEGAEPADAQLQFVLADASAPPFAAASFDTVVTPWLLDILPTDLPAFLPVINQLLPIGGRWLNTGSLAFAANPDSDDYCPDEVKALVRAAGFDILAFEQRSQDYLGSPLSAHSRREVVYTFCAAKVKNITAAAPGRQVDAAPWLTDPSIPIPKVPSYEIVGAEHLLHAQVLGAIDGERTLPELAELLGRKYQIPPAEAQAAIETILSAQRT